LDFDKGAPSGNTLVFTITGTPTDTFNDNLNIEGSGVSCAVRLVIEPADPTPTSLSIYGSHFAEPVFGESGFISLEIVDNLDHEITDATLSFDKTLPIGIT
jgi:hypothetical protein